MPCQASPSSLGRTYRHWLESVACPRRSEQCGYYSGAKAPCSSFWFDLEICEFLGIIWKGYFSKKTIWKRSLPKSKRPWILNASWVQRSLFLGRSFGTLWGGLQTWKGLAMVHRLMNIAMNLLFDGLRAMVWKSSDWPGAFMEYYSLVCTGYMWLTDC